MIGLAGFVMRGRSQAAMAATALALLALLAPPLSILSSAVVTLVTLRQGLTDGLAVGGISALASSLLAFLLLGSPAPVLGFLLVLWLPVWVLGSLLRSSRSLSQVVQLAVGFGLVLLAVLNLQLEQPEAHWAQMLQPMAEGFVQAGILEAARGDAFVLAMVPWMSGIFAAGFYLQLLLALFLARAWQARLYNPGGFAQEFAALRVSRPLALLGLPLLGLLLLQGGTAPALVRDLGLLLAPLFFFQGLAVAHAVARHAGLHRAWLVALYVLLFLAIPHAQVLLLLVGLADALVDVRARLVKPGPPPA
jgi:hypothetical protein